MPPDKIDRKPRSAVEYSVVIALAIALFSWTRCARPKGSAERIREPGTERHRTYADSGTMRAPSE